MSLPQDTIDKLNADFEESRVKIKQIKGRPDASYLESYDVINKANEVFGYGGWGTHVVKVDMVPVDNKTVCIATVQLDVEGCLPRQDVGVVVSAGDSAEALETAAKGAVSDGMKRNLRHFGKQFGNDLYAKDGDASKKPSKTKGAKSAKKAKPEHPSVQYWRYVRGRNIDDAYAQDFLNEVDKDYEAALAGLREEFGD